MATKERNPLLVQQIMGAQQIGGARAVVIGTSHLGEAVSVSRAGYSYRFGDLSFLPSGAACVWQGSAGWSDFPHSGGIQPCPGPTKVAGGLSRREVH